MTELPTGGVHRGFKGSRIMGSPWNRIDLAALMTFQHQPTAVLNQAAPVQNTWYTALATTLNVRVYSLVFRVAATGENLELRAIADGVTISGAVAGGANTWYEAILEPTVAETFFITVPVQYQYRAFMMEARSISVEVRKTSANGVGNLMCNVVHARRI